MKTQLQTIVAVLTGLASAGSTVADDLPRTRSDFFEAKIRPVLVEHCYECHSGASDPLQGGLRVDTADGLRRGGDSGAAIVAGAPQDSVLLSALRYESFEMPPAGRLPERVIHDFEVWVRDGAVDPRRDDSESSETAADPADPDAGRAFWAFQVPQRSPWLEARGQQSGERVTGSERIDALVERRLAEAGLSPNAAADARTLLRRLTFDLTGLPPDPQDVAAFSVEDSPAAFRRHVDRLLSSPAYGERWARLWLDVARYAEDQAHIVGNNKSLFYPNAWKYRDWVIRALNDDLPYDAFIRLQLAADQIVPDDDEAQAALGFLGLGPKYYRRGDPEVMADEWEDRVDVVSRGLLGLTVACARCHDHKYDPIGTEDYYGLAGVFASTEMYNKPLHVDVARDKKGQAKDPADALHVIRDGDVTDLAVMIRGNVDQRGEVVPRGLPAVLLPPPRREFHDGSGRRELADAIANPRNPLTARVIVNRVWQEYFGRGLVATPSNFGRLGERPTHPELLDDLAVRFMDAGWSLKWLHREIVLSRTWQRSSARSPEAEALDPANRMLWRMPRRRLSIEAWRDAVLTAAGVLNEDVGGESIPPGDVAQTRRTVYASVSRMDLDPLLARFDFPDPNVHAARRTETNTPLQKLFLLNSPFMLQMSDHLAERAAGSGTASGVRIRSLFELALQRPPAADELQAAEAYLTEHPQRGLRQLAQTLLVSNEFWYLD